MLRKILILLALTATPAFAGDGTTPVIVFRNHAQRSTEILWTKSSNIHAPDDVYDFTPSNGDMQAGDYLNSYPQPGYTYSPPAADTGASLPNLVGFKTAIASDPSIPVTALVELSKFTGALNDAVSNPQLLQSLWAGIKQTESTSTPPGPLAGNCNAPNSSLTIFAEIEAEARANNIPLVP